MPAPIIPWEPANIPTEIQGELNRRKVNRSFKYVDGAKGEWGKDDGEWTKYRGPMSPWARFCSNGAGREIPKGSGNFPQQGFVMFGGKGFYSEYGFNKQASSNLENMSIIGYMPNGVTPHVIENDLKTSNHPIHVPVPEIEKISVTIQKELYRRASIEWVCFSKAQLEYMTPYFLVPGISCILEFGWNLYNPESLVDLDDIGKLKSYDKDPYPLYTTNILNSKGNYDVLFGIITHFEWTVEGNKIKCKTEITSKDRIYSGLVVDSKSEIQTKDDKGKEGDSKPLGSLVECVNKVLPQFRNVATDPALLGIPLVKDYVKYIMERHPDNWQEYVYGVFYGRDMEDKKTPLAVVGFGGAVASAPPSDDNKKEDFDRKSQNKDLWLNLGLVIECINYCCSALKSPGNTEAFRVDINDVVINAHPNLISCDGTVLLIPNSDAPKYFNGQYGYSSSESKDQNKSDYGILSVASNLSKTITKAEAKKAYPNKLADYRIRAVCLPMGGTIPRDNLDELINKLRYEKTKRGTGYNAFPFSRPFSSSPGTNSYPAGYTGLLRDLYVNVNHLKTLAESGDIKTYYQFIEKMLANISDAAGGFWDFRIVSSTGQLNQPISKQASMAIVDYKFMFTINRGSPFTFDYFDSDSLLLGLNFKPTLSNAQAIRTMYAPTNQPTGNVTLTNGDNELLDYKFRDRLRMDTDLKSTTPPSHIDTQHAETMRSLQQISPPNGAYQMTTITADKKAFVRRLVLPSPEILKMLLDDGDEENNPKYTGVMPNIQATFTIQGIGGLRTFMMFLVRNLPEPYSELDIVFRIVDIQDSIESGKWTTTITAGIIPLRGYIKKRLGIPSKSS